MIKANVHAGRGAGKFRDPWEIKKFLSSIGTNMTQVSRDIGTYPQVVQETVHGSRNHRKTLAHLRDLGCPLEALSLPEDLKTMEA